MKFNLSMSFITGLDKAGKSEIEKSSVNGELNNIAKLAEEINEIVSTKYTNKRTGEIDSLISLGIISSSKLTEEKEVQKENLVIQQLLTNLNNHLFDSTLKGAFVITVFPSGDRQILLSSKAKTDFSKVSVSDIDKAFAGFKKKAKNK
jgi:hypothetical protein